MLQPAELSHIHLVQRMVRTSLGQMVYYQTDPPASTDTPAEHHPLLVFLHGFGGGSSAFEWSKVFPALAAQYPILAPDLLGWGRSDHPARNYCIDDYLTTLSEFIQQTCPQPIVAIASSLTAAFTIRLAIDHPEWFKSLILVAPSGLSDFGQDFRRSPIAQLVSLPLVDRLLYTVGIATPNGIRSFLEDRQFARRDRVSPELVNAYLASAQQPNAEYSALSFVRGDLCFDLALFIPQLTVPTAFIWGQQAQFTNVRLGQRLAALNPTAIRQFIVLEDVGLTPQLELPAVTIGLLQQLIRFAQPTILDR